jgi:hypothetical protein
MTETEIVHDAEVIGTEIEPVATGTLFRTEDPVEVIRRATDIAAPLADVVRKQKLVTMIQGREHVRVEGWTLLGSMLGVFPVVEWSRQLPDGWEARVEARTLSGAVVGAAEAECLRTENTWKNRDDYALRSMAQTRAVSKALRGPLGFVMQLAGFEATPAEEMPAERLTGVQGNEYIDGSGEVIARKVEGPKPLTAPTSWAKWEEMVSAYDEQVHDWFVAFTQSTARLLFGPTVDTKKLAASDKKLLLQKAAGAAVFVREQFEPNEFPPPSLEDVRAAFARVLDGQELAIPDESESADKQASAD